MSMQHDPELDDVLQDQELMRLAELLRQGRMSDPPLDDAFRSALRRQLMNRAWGMGGGGTPWWQNIFGPATLAWAGSRRSAGLGGYPDHRPTAGHARLGPRFAGRPGSGPATFWGFRDQAGAAADR